MTLVNVSAISVQEELTTFRLMRALVKSRAVATRKTGRMTRDFRCLGNSWQERDIRRCMSKIRDCRCWSNLSRFTHVGHGRWDLQHCQVLEIRRKSNRSGTHVGHLWLRRISDGRRTWSQQAEPRMSRQVLERLMRLIPCRFQQAPQVEE